MTTVHRKSTAQYAPIKQDGAPLNAPTNAPLSDLQVQLLKLVQSDPGISYDQLAALTGRDRVTRIVQETQPDEICNLGAQSHVAVSIESPEYTADVDGMGTLHLLESISPNAVAKMYAYCLSQNLKPPRVVWR